MTDVLIEAIGVGAELGGHRVVDGVSLRASAGQVTGIIGPNGAGKTTFLRALAGLLPAATGELRVAGLDPRAAAPGAMAAQRAYSPQKPASAWDFRLAELGLLSGDPAAYAGWLDAFGLAAAPELPLSALSGGEQKCAHLALAFVALGDPFGRVLLLDEPGAALDLNRQATLRRIVAGFARAGAAVVVATHDLGFARGCDQVLVLAEGRLIATGDPAATLTPAVVGATWGEASSPPA